MLKLRKRICKVEFMKINLLFVVFTVIVSEYNWERPYLYDTRLEGAKE